MSARFRIPDRNPQLLLSPNLHDWLPEDDLVYFVMEAIEGMSLPPFHVNHRGSGSPQYDSKMMLSLLIYCYATGTFSSRRIEAATYRDVAVRVLCGGLHPDHDTICTFRRLHQDVFQDCFVQVLELAKTMKLLKVGNISIDGTKINANASKHAAVSYKRAGEILEGLREEVEQLMKKAEETDSTPLQDGLTLPAELARRAERRQQMEKARHEIETKAKAAAEIAQKEFDAKVKERQDRRDKGEKVRGRNPVAPNDQPKEKDQYNFTDPQSRIMKAGNGQHFEQDYNAQLAVDADGSMLILGKLVTDQSNDKQQLVPVTNSIAPETGQPEAAIADTGFYSEKAVEQIESQGISAYVAVEKGHHHRTVAELEKQPEAPPLPEDATAKEKMVHRLRSEEGKQIYSKRHQTVEPIIGIIKEVMGFRQFLLRGLEKVAIEWDIVTLAYNFKRLHKLIQNKTREELCPAAAKNVNKEGKKGELREKLAAKVLLQPV